MHQCHVVLCARLRQPGASWWVRLCGQHVGVFLFILCARWSAPKPASLRASLPSDACLRGVLFTSLSRPAQPVRCWLATAEWNFNLLCCTRAAFFIFLGWSAACLGNWQSRVIPGLHVVSTAAQLIQVFFLKENDTTSGCITGQNSHVNSEQIKSWPPTTSPGVKGWCLNAQRRAFNYRQQALIYCCSAPSFNPNFRCQQGAEKLKHKRFWGRRLIVHEGEFDFLLVDEVVQGYFHFYFSTFYLFILCVKATAVLWHGGILSKASFAFLLSCKLHHHILVKEGRTHLFFNNWSQ